MFPAPKRLPGVRLGGHLEATLHVSVYLDFQCPFSRRCWPVIKELVQNYPAGDLEVTVLTYVSATHSQSFDAARTAAVVQLKHPDKYFEFVQLLFDNQDEFSSDECLDKTRRQMIAYFADLASRVGVSEEEFVNTVDKPPVLNAYHASQRAGIAMGVWATPAFIVNGARTDVPQSSWGLPQWKEYLDGLLKLTPDNEKH